MRRNVAGLVLGILVSWSTAASAQPAVPPPVEEPTSAEAPASTVATGTPLAPSDVNYGMAARLRWISVPGWLLGVFLEEHQSLSSYGFAAEFFRRKGDLDITLGVAYQKMGPPDGNWLGRGQVAADETDLIQFRNFGFVGFDLSFIWRTVISEYVAFRYGAGLGLAIITGEMLRVSNIGCTPQNAGNTRECRPRYCPPTGCTEKLHVDNAQNRVDNGPTDPHRFKDPNVPGAVPILNLVTGFDFHIPNVKGLELRVEGGFYDAFFLGLAAGYVF
jgi:hypothetical protein